MKIPLYQGMYLAIEGIPREDSSTFRDNATAYQDAMKLRRWLRAGGSDVPRVRIPRKAKKRWFGTKSRRRIACG